MKTDVGGECRSVETAAYCASHSGVVRGLPEVSTAVEKRHSTYHLSGRVCGQGQPWPRRLAVSSGASAASTASVLFNALHASCVSLPVGTVLNLS